MAFEQAGIKVQREAEFEELKAAIAGAFSAEKLGGFLVRVRRTGIRIRDFDSVLRERLLEPAGGRAREGESALDLYAALPLTDQAQLKEFYLSKVEEVGPGLRARFHKVYQYY